MTCRISVLLATLVACGPASTVPGETNETDAGGKNVNDNGCAGGVSEAIFVVDLNSDLHRFLPATNQFQRIGTVSCQVPSDVTPFSMSVDRQGTAWMLFSDGSIHNVSTENASCQSTSYQSGQRGFEFFGMGFVSDDDGSNEETLHLSKSTDGFGQSELAVLDTNTLQVTFRGGMSHTTDFGPELTGTGSGELYGYFPGLFGSEIQQISKSNGNTLQTWNLGGVIDVTAWAFAHFGGEFFIFVTDGGNSKVQKFSPSNGNLVTELSDIGFEIVGAGVSTCAPVIID